MSISRIIKSKFAKYLLPTISFSILVGFLIGLVLSRSYITPNFYLKHKIYRLILLYLQKNLNKGVFLLIPIAVCLYVYFSIILFFIKKLYKGFIKNIFDINIREKNMLIRFICASSLSLLFLIYDGWLINHWYIPNKILIIKILVNMALLPLAVLLWLLLVKSRWEKFWTIILKIRNPLSKFTNLVAIILVIFLIILNLSIFIDRKIIIPDSPNIILIGIDTLRADHLGCYGYKKNITPNIDQFSKDSVLFKNCIVQAPSTTASFASIFTSLIPSHHGASASFHNMSRITPQAITIAEFLKNNYYWTFSYNGGYQVSEDFGFDRAFDAYNSEEDKNFCNIVDLAEKCIDSHKNKSFFLFLHSYEVHSPYTPRQDLLQRLEDVYEGNLPKDIDENLLAKINDGELDINDSDIQHIINTYDAEIISMDEAFGELVEFLKINGYYDDALIIFTSDHGEEFNEHGLIGKHSRIFYDEVLRVPLIIKFPNSFCKAKRIEEQVRSIDILPTLLDWLNLDVLHYFDGVSLLSLINGSEQRKESFSISEELDQFPQSSSDNAIRTNKWKLYGEKLFDLENDPGETKNVISTHSKITDFLKAKSEEIIYSDKFIDSEDREANSIKMRKELKQQIKSLGYL